jgi:hypothetical protein
MARTVLITEHRTDARTVPGALTGIQRRSGEQRDWAAESRAPPGAPGFSRLIEAPPEAAAGGVFVRGGNSVGETMFPPRAPFFWLVVPHRAVGLSGE